MPSGFYTHPFTLGLLLGLVFAGLAIWRVISLKWEIRRFKQHLSDRIELEAAAVSKMKGEVEALRKENENLRVRISEFQQKPDWRAVRELEVFARAEKRMTLNAPGFAAAWENAKNAAHEELTAEESGKSLSKRVFNRLFGGGAALPEASNNLPPPSSPDETTRG